MSIDQGLRYELCALVADLPVLEAVVARPPYAGLEELAVVGLEQGKAMLPVTSAVSSTLAGRGAPVPPETGFWVLSPGVLQLVADASVAGPVAYLEADYLGHDGRQTAAVWEAGELAHGPYLLGRSEPFVPGESPIGTALRHVGVVAAGRRDEFVVLGLGLHRRTEQWV